jgi:ABC-type amino acid transport substrate-binding protein
VFDGLVREQTHHYPNPQQAFAGMQRGEVHAVMAMRGEIDWQVAQAADPNLALAENAYPNMGRQVWDIGMAVHESNRQLAYALEEQLETLILDGKVKAIYAEYGLRYELPGLYQDVE